VVLAELVVVVLVLGWQLRLLRQPLELLTQVAVVVVVLGTVQSLTAQRVVLELLFWGIQPITQLQLELA